MLKRLAVFVSGSGSDLQAILDAIQNKQLENTEISIVIASKQGIYALERAKKANIKSLVFEKKDYISTDFMFEDIINLLIQEHIDYIVLAGYLTILTKNIIKQFEGRIINIHPSLIPAFCGDGFYGMRVHKAVIEAGAKKSGATVHFVDEGTDTGEIIMQEEIEVFENDTPESLQKRVLELEHKLLPKALQHLISRSKQ